MGMEFAADEAWAITRRDHPHLESWYVINGLELFLSFDPGNRKRLVNLYRRLPRHLRILDIGRTEEGRFTANPERILLHHELQTLLSAGELRAAEAVMKRLQIRG